MIGKKTNIFGIKCIQIEKFMICTKNIIFFLKFWKNSNVFSTILLPI